MTREIYKIDADRMKISVTATTYTDQSFVLVTLNRATQFGECEPNAQEFHIEDKAMAIAIIEALTKLVNDNP